MKIRHKVNFGWTPPDSPHRSDEISDRYEGEVNASVRRAERAHAKAQQALERAERRLAEKPSIDARDAVETLRAEVERRFQELRELEIQMQQAPASGANWSGKDSVRNPLPKGTKL